MTKPLFVLTLVSLLLVTSSFVENPSPSLSKSLVFPVMGKKAKVGSFWGASRDGGKRKHQGIDIFARKGTAVVAICDGYISTRATTPRGGKVLWLRSSDHSWTAYYAHLDQWKVKKGQFVRKGQIIGTVGNTGNARTTPPHLHFGIYTRKGAVNPYPYVKNSRRLLKPPSSTTVAKGEFKYFAERQNMYDLVARLSNLAAS